MTGLPESPYKGLSAFEDSELDALLFFGREREREIVVANLIASRLTVLYGPSGVGKSSLLRAAVARSLRELPEAPLVVVFSRWSEDPAAALSEEVVEAAGLDASVSAFEGLERAQVGRDVYLVLDQAEEYFLYHADERGPGTFAELLPAVLTSQLRVNVLVSLREDSLAKLDRFTGRIPGLFANTLRLDRLDREAARAAVMRPVERFAELTGEAVAVEPELVERVLDEVGTGRIEPATGGLGAVDSVEDGARIEAPYLQLVMQRLWDEERAVGSDTLQADTLARLGGAQQIVEEHLESALGELTPSQEDVASRLFNHLVTPTGTKIAHELDDLVDFGGVPLEELQPVLATLTKRRILRSLQEGGVVRYEIFHDVLAQPVLAWRTQHEADRELAVQTEAADRRHRRLLAVVALGSVLLVVMAAVTVFALTQRSEARSQAQEAKAHELEARATILLDSDPELSLLLARTAALMTGSETAEATLSNALVMSRVRTIVDVGEPLLGAMLRGGDVRAATTNGSVVIADGVTGEIHQKVASGTQAVDASFAKDGAVLLTGRDGRLRMVGPAGAVATVPGLDGVKGAVVSSDGSLALAIGDRRVRLVEVKSGVVRSVFPHRGAISAAISTDNRRVATGSADGSVRVWIAQSGRRVRSLPGNKGHPAALAFSPDAAFVAAASTDGVGRVWRFAFGGVGATLTGSATSLTDVGYSTDGVYIVTASHEGDVHVSSADTGSQRLVLQRSRRVGDVRDVLGSGRELCRNRQQGRNRTNLGRVRPASADRAWTAYGARNCAGGRRGRSRACNFAWPRACSRAQHREGARCRARQDAAEHDRWPEWDDRDDPWQHGRTGDRRPDEQSSRGTGTGCWRRLSRPTDAFSRQRAAITPSKSGTRGPGRRSTCCRPTRLSTTSPSARTGDGSLLQRHEPPSGIRWGPIRYCAFRAMRVLSRPFGSTPPDASS